jgi:hypothetical protein
MRNTKRNRRSAKELVQFRKIYQRRNVNVAFQLPLARKTRIITTTIYTHYKKSYRLDYMGTELSFLFRRNAEICAEMSSSAKSAEVRDQWTELAAHWSQKAEANEALAVTAADLEPPIHSSSFGITQLRQVELGHKPTPAAPTQVSPTSIDSSNLNGTPRDNKETARWPISAPISTIGLIPLSSESPKVAPDEEASPEPTLSPVLAPEDQPLLIEERLDQSVTRREFPGDKGGAFDEFWRLLIADIRAK